MGIYQWRKLSNSANRRGGAAPPGHGRRMNIFTLRRQAWLNIAWNSIGCIGMFVTGAQTEWFAANGMAWRVRRGVVSSIIEDGQAGEGGGVKMAKGVAWRALSDGSISASWRRASRWRWRRVIIGNGNNVMSNNSVIIIICILITNNITTARSYLCMVIFSHISVFSLCGLPFTCCPTLSADENAHLFCFF